MSEAAFDERRRKDMVDARLLRRSFDSEVGANEIEDGEKRVPNARLAINLRVCKLLRAREMNFQHSPPPSSLRRETTAPPNPSSRTSTRTAPVSSKIVRAIASHERSPNRQGRPNFRVKNSSTRSCASKISISRSSSATANDVSIRKTCRCKAAKKRLRGDAFGRRQTTSIASRRSAAFEFGTLSGRRRRQKAFDEVAGDDERCSFHWRFLLCLFGRFSPRTLARRFPRREAARETRRAPLPSRSAAGRSGPALPRELGFLAPVGR